MFNGYNETPLISYNEFNQDRIEKQENVPKWSYGQDAGVQPAQNHPNNRHSDFWSGKSNFLGLSNVVKCNCTGCYSSSENQSYQGDINRHRPWLPRTFPVLLNNSSESCKLPAYQWDNGLSSQSSCYPDSNLTYAQENGGKYPYFRHYQNSKLPESNQPGVITSVKDVEYVKKPKNEMSSRTLESPIQNGTRQPVFCNSAYSLTKRTDGRNYCDPNDKYSNVASYSVDQHIPRLPVVEPFIKAVPSNLSQNRVPSTGYRNVKENIPQPYNNSGFGDARKICTEPTINSDKRNKAFSTGQLQSGAHIDHSLLKRDVHEEEPQKLFFDNCRHPDYYPRGSIQDAMKRNNQILDNKKDYVINQISQMGMSEQPYNMPRPKYQEMENSKLSYEAYYPEEFEKIKPENHLLENSACFQRIEDNKNENTNIHARLPRSELLFNGPRFDNTQNSFSYHSDPASYRNHLRPEYSYQNFNAQVRFEYPAGFQRNDCNQYRVAPQQIQNGEQLNAQQNGSFVYNLHCQQNPDKTQQFCGEKNPSLFHGDFQSAENKKVNYLEEVRSEEIKKNGTSKISPLRLLRKKKFINVPHESTPTSTLDSAPGLDVRKFWSTWAEEEEENLAPSQMVVLDCQNIDLEQAKLLNLYETDPVRAVHLESGNIVIKGTNYSKDSSSEAVQFEQIKTYEESVVNEPKIDEQKNCENEKSAFQHKRNEETEDNSSVLASGTESKSAITESACHIKSPPKVYKKTKSEQGNRNKKKSEAIDKWTEKKFDFLKRAEESKAAEILRHEEEKKKIFETRQSIQQSLKKVERQEKNIIEEDENVPERISSFNENSQSDSPQDGGSDTFNLPTSEYRRNKFLDYSDRKVILKDKDKTEKNATVGANLQISNESSEEETKENVKLDCSDKKPEKHQTETLVPFFNGKLKKEADIETDDNLKKMSDIDFQSPGIKFEEVIESNVGKKSRPLVKKPKNRKSDQQTESDERKDKLTVETVSKPTIKFSIEKSHDLKISFKVLNNNKEYSDMDARGGEDVETKKNPTEDSKNSTELITLKYKSIQRDGDRRQSADFIRSRRGFRRKKRGLEKRTPVLKIKKSRYMPEKERDSLADEDECVNSSKKPYPSDEYATSKDFQVQETVDSAKIKLTFKRHKGNFETEYKINSNDVEKVSAPELGPIREDFDEHLELTKSKKRSRKAKRKQELFSEANIESFKSNSRPSTDVESDSENSKTYLESVFEEDSRNSSTSLGSCRKKENFLKLEVPIFSEFPLECDKFTLSEGKKIYDDIDDLKSNGETNKCGQEQEELAETPAINCDDDNGSEDSREESSLLNCNASPVVNLKEMTVVEALAMGTKREEETNCFEKEEIQEISVDFIRSTKSPEIETNHISDETETLLNSDNNIETLKEKSSFRLESSSEVMHSHDSEYEKNDENVFGSESLNITEDLYGPLNDADSLSDNLSDRAKPRGEDLEEISSTFVSSSKLESENFGKNHTSPVKSETASKLQNTNGVILPFEPNSAEKCSDEFKGNCDGSNSLQTDKSAPSDLEFRNPSVKSPIENFVGNDIVRDNSTVIDQNETFSTSKTSFDGSCVLAEFKNSSPVSEELNVRVNSCDKSSSPAHPEETPILKTTRSFHDFEMPFESRENTVESDLECTAQSIERTFEETPDEICENLSSEPAPENSFSKNFNNCVMQCYGTVKPFEEVELSSVNVTDSSGDAPLEADANGGKDVSELGDYSFLPLEETVSSENALKDTNNLSNEVIQSEKPAIEGADGNHHDISQDVDLSAFQVIMKNEENLHFSPKTDDLEQLGEKFLENISDCTIPSDSNSVRQTLINDIKPDLPSLSDIELEDGEIIDSSDELDENALDGKQIVNTVLSSDECVNSNKTKKKLLNFICRIIERRHSVKPETLRGKNESQNPDRETWFEIEFSRAKSCPPEIQYPDEIFDKTEETLNIRPEDIPLPIGPPPYSSCLNLKKYLRVQAELQVKEKPNAFEQSRVNQKDIPSSDPPVGLNNLQDPPKSDDSARLGIFQRSSKIKFSFSKRSRFSKNGGKDTKESGFEVLSGTAVSESKIEEDLEKKKVESPDFESKLIQMQVGVSVNDQNECQIKEVPNVTLAGKAEEAKNFSDSVEMKKSLKDLEQPVGLLCEDLDEKVKVIDALSDFIADEFYECEDIPTSEDLTNGDDLENEKVNDDKFRNIMQNCLDNAKKFLNVGNLKLFSCSVDDLLELDCQASESGLGESESEKTTNHISRDVLLTSCEDTIDDLGLSENVPPPDISMDFVPSFCSDVCSEILPVDNWPYLEEEVPSSPTKLKQDETDLIPSLENISLNLPSGSCLQFRPKNGIERSARKQVVGENNFKSFRRRSLISCEESSKMCSKIDAQRRKTIESFTGGSFDVKNELAKLNGETNEREKRSLKCQLSLEKLTNKHEINLELKSEKVKRESKMGKKSAKNLNYKSPSWQPRVMLFRISKNDLRKVAKTTETQKPSKSKNSGNFPTKKEMSYGPDDDIPIVKKQKFVSKVECEERKTDGDSQSDGKIVDLPRLDSIKGSLTPATSTNREERRHRKPRFRNLHSKRKITSDTSKDESSFAQNVQMTAPTIVHAETILMNMFKDCNRSSNSLVKNTKEVILEKNGDKKLDAAENHQNRGSKSEERLGGSHGKSKECLKEDRHCEKAKKLHHHRDKRRDKREDKEQRKQEKHRESESKKHDRHSRNRHSWTSSRADGDLDRYKRDKSRSGDGGHEKKWKNAKEDSSEGSWTCEVCGFEDVSQRVVHIKSHPLHCQSCHLAFKTENHFISHLTKRHKDIRNQHHCLLCELSFDTQEQYHKHLETREHTHLESVEKNTINTLFTVLTGAPCPVLGLVEMKPEWLPNQAGTVHFYHQATPLSLALQYLKMHHDLSSFSTAPSAHPT